MKNGRLTISVKTLLISMMLIQGSVVGVNAQTPKKQAGSSGSQEQASSKAPMPVTMFKVNGTEVTVSDYAGFLQKHPSIVSKAMTTDDGKVEAVKEMIISALLLEAMQKEGFLTKNPKEAEPKDLIAAYEKLAEKHFPRQPQPEEKVIYQYYKDHPEEFGIPAMIRVKQIQLKLPRDADEAKKLEVVQRGEAILKRLDNGESFEKLATENTENPIGKLTEGDIGFISQNTPESIRLAVKDIKIGEYTRLVSTPTGVEILKVTDSRPELLAPYANVRDKVSKNLIDAQQTKDRLAYAKELAKSAKIEIVEPTLKALMPGEILK